MRVCYQPTEDVPGDWKEIQASGWAGLSRFACHALCIQGCVFDGADHYAVETVSPGVIRVVVWHDDPGDWPAGQRWAREWVFRHLKASADPAFGGAIRPEHKQTIYCEDGIGKVLRMAYGRTPGVMFRPWRDFDPRRVNPMPGQWVTDKSHEAHRAKQSVKGWRTWTEGLAPADIDANGLVKDQRDLGRYEVPKGTRTYYHRDTDRAVTFASADAANAFETTTGAAALETYVANQGGSNVWIATTPANEPDAATWPTTGTYRYQIDATSVGADLTFGLLTQGGGADGGFHRVTANLATSQVKVQQDQAAFIGSGLHLASITDENFNGATPLASDVFSIVISSVRVAGHGNQNMTLQLNETDDYADGPWPGAVVAEDDAVFFGCNF
jgi:hypothetical protein